MYFCDFCGQGQIGWTDHNRHVSKCRARSALDEMEAERLKRNTEYAADFSEEDKERIRNWKVDPCAPSFRVADPLSSVALPIYYHIIPGGLGSDGIVVVEREEGGVVVVKAVGRPEGDIFASLLLRKVGACLPIKYWRTPPLRPMFSRSDEFASLTRKLKMLENIRDGGSNAPFINRISQKQFLLIIEFEVAASAFATARGAFSHFWSPATLRGVGGMVAMDMLLNNWDRLPVPKLWKNEGNLGNLLFVDRSDGEEEGAGASNLIVIDQTVTAIWDAARKSHYVDKVRNMLAEPDFAWLPAYLQMCCGFPEVPNTIVDEVTVGFNEVVRWIKDNADTVHSLIKESHKETLECVVDQSGASSDEAIVANVVKQTGLAEEFLHDIVCVIAEFEL